MKKGFFFCISLTILAVLSNNSSFASTCSRSFKSKLVEKRNKSMQENMQSYIRDQLDKRKSEEKPVKLIFTKLENPNEFLVLVNRNFPESEILLRKYLDSNTYRYIELEFFGYNVFHLEKLNIL